MAIIEICEVCIPTIGLWSVDWADEEEHHPHDYIGNWLWDDGGCILWDDNGVIKL